MSRHTTAAAAEDIASGIAYTVRKKPMPRIFSLASIARARATTIVAGTTMRVRDGVAHRLERNPSRLRLAIYLSRPMNVVGTPRTFVAKVLSQPVLTAG